MLVDVFNAKQKCKATTAHLSYVNKTSHSALSRHNKNRTHYGSSATIKMAKKLSMNQ
jgi:hypothetical protein